MYIICKNLLLDLHDKTTAYAISAMYEYLYIKKETFIFTAGIHW